MKTLIHWFRMGLQIPCEQSGLSAPLKARVEAGEVSS